MTILKQLLRRLGCEIHGHDWPQWGHVEGSEHRVANITVILASKRFPMPDESNRCLRCGVPITETDDCIPAASAPAPAATEGAA